MPWLEVEASHASLRARTILRTGGGKESLGELEHDEKSYPDPYPRAGRQRVHAPVWRKESTLTVS